MCKCYSNKTKNMCQKVVGGISLLLGVLGLVTLAFGAMSSGGTPDAFKSMAAKMPKGSIPSSGGGPILGLGVVIMVTSVLGCATAKFKNPCFAIPFGILTLIFGLILLIIGFLAMAISSP